MCSWQVTAEDVEALLADARAACGLDKSNAAAAPTPAPQFAL